MQNYQQMKRSCYKDNTQKNDYLQTPQGVIYYSLGFQPGV